MDTKINGYDGPLNVPWIKLLNVPLHMFVKNDQTQIPITVQVANNTPIKEINVNLIPPGFQPPPPRDPNPESDHMAVDPVFINTKLLDREGDGSFTGTLDSQTGAFPEGDYLLSLYASSDAGIQDSFFAPATVNPTGMAPPDTTPPGVAITTPLDSSTVSGSISIAAADDDQGLDRVEMYVDDVLLETLDMPGYYPYPELVLHFTNP
jgi:hypothetical protein